LAWVTGIVMVAFLWFIGWTGYWLIWDEPGQRVAVGTAQLLDVLPIFADPLARSFLTDAGVNTFLFFVIFFFHMLIPLGIGMALWLHLARLSRARFLTRRPLLIWVFASLLLVSVLLPADQAGPARMTALSQTFEMDWWYLAPLIATDRLGGGALWAIVLLGGAALLAVPWSMGRGRARAANVVVSHCNACEKCYNDCPYDAISMIPRTDGSSRYSTQSSVDPTKCVLEWFSVRDQRKRLAGWLMRALTEDGEAPHVAFLCAESAAASLVVDPETGKCAELPGYLVVGVPCAGWIHPFGIEHSLRFGAKGALVSTCGPGACRYREGAEWERMRLDGEREPALRTQKVERDRLLFVSLDATQRAELVRVAREFREGNLTQPAPRTRPTPVVLLAASLVAAVVAGLLGAFSQLGYATPRGEGSELVVSFKHPGQLEENCRELTEEELARRPIHMRQTQICDRARASVRLRVSVDGVPVMEQSYPPKGVWGDLNSVAIEPLPIEPGEHRVGVAIGDSADPDQWGYTDERTLSFTDSARRVVLFDRVAGFTWH
jgi:coenzyme F420-reducing hydrogenase delta subunit/NAD-dependent dihydropyrimidine dehydrogenase PreA subunit